MFLGISLQGSQDRLIRIEPHLQGATVGYVGRRLQRFLNRSSPSNAFPNKPSPIYEGCHPPSSFLQDQVGHVKPKQKREVTPELSGRWRSCVGGHPCTKGWKTVKGPGRRSIRWMMWQGGHASRPYSRGTKICVNLKGL
jgi:hypothetical protein